MTSLFLVHCNFTEDGTENLNKTELSLGIKQTNGMFKIFRSREKFRIGEKDILMQEQYPEKDIEIIAEIKNEIYVDLIKKQYNKEQVSDQHEGGGEIQ